MSNTFGRRIDRSTIIRYTFYLLLTILLSFINATILDFMQIGEVLPDLILILVVFITLREGHFIGLFAGFLAGLILDVISLDVIGTNALAKLIVAFIAGFFYKEGKQQKILSSINFILIILGTSVIHNLVYFFFYIKVSNINLFAFFIKYGIATSLYTAVISIIPVLLNFRRREINI